LVKKDAEAQPENYAFFLEDIARKMMFLRRRYFEF
jgi:hypothetical protein